MDVIILKDILSTIIDDVDNAEYLIIIFIMQILLHIFFLGMTELCRVGKYEWLGEAKQNKFKNS